MTDAPLSASVPRAWLWRRILTYACLTALAAVALVAVFRAPDPLWLGVAAIAAMWLMQTVYVIGATAEDIVRITQAATEGLARAKGAGGPNYGS